MSWFLNRCKFLYSLDILIQCCCWTAWFPIKLYDSFLCKLCSFCLVHEKKIAQRLAVICHAIHGSVWFSTNLALLQFWSKTKSKLFLHLHSTDNCMPAILFKSMSLLLSPSNLRVQLLSNPCCRRKKIELYKSCLLQLYLQDGQKHCQ